MFIGIDLTSSQERPCAYAVLDASGTAVVFGHLGTDDEILQAASQHQASVVAIDAPLGYPKGQCCLEEACPCSPQPHKGRACERELARMGISCFYTTKRSIIKAMVYRAVALAGRLSAQGHQVLEVYPYASKVRLFGRRIPSKMKPEGLAFLRKHLQECVPGLEYRLGELDHDLCDALIAAYTGYLHALGRTQTLGIPEEGQMMVPAVSLLSPNETHRRSP